MFEHVSLPDIERVSRRTVFSALGLGVCGLVVCVLTGAPLVGLGLCLGLGLGILNFHMIQRSVAKIGAGPAVNKRRPLAANTLGRLAVISVIALGLLFLNFNLGLGTMAGLAVFQLLLLVSVARSMLRAGGLAALGGDVDPEGDPEGDAQGRSEGDSEGATERAQAGDGSQASARSAADGADAVDDVRPNGESGGAAVLGASLQLRSA